jgi:hypothetical protein
MILKICQNKIYFKDKINIMINILEINLEKDKQDYKRQKLIQVLGLQIILIEKINLKKVKFKLLIYKITKTYKIMNKIFNFKYNLT